MKKIIAVVIMSALLITGCSTNKEESSNEEKENIVYCELCGEESKEVTKFCPNCGEETKWVVEKPRIEDEKQEEVELKQEKVKVESNYSKNSYKSIYLKKLADLDAEEEYIWSVNSGTTMDMRRDASYMYERWDDMLNEIYGVLKKQLSTSEMNALRDKQRAWIKYRDQEAEEAKAQYEGGTLAPLEYTVTRESITRDRCYELVNVYMK